MNNNLFRPGIGYSGDPVAAEGALNDALIFLQVYDNWNKVDTWAYEFEQPDGSIIQIQKLFGESYNIHIIGVAEEEEEVDFIPDRLYLTGLTQAHQNKMYRVYDDGTFPTLVYTFPSQHSIVRSTLVHHIGRELEDDVKHIYYTSDNTSFPEIFFDDDSLYQSIGVELVNDLVIEGVDNDPEGIILGNSKYTYNTYVNGDGEIDPIRFEKYVGFNLISGFQAIEPLFPKDPKVYGFGFQGRVANDKCIFNSGLFQSIPFPDGGQHWTTIIDLATGQVKERFPFNDPFLPSNVTRDFAMMGFQGAGFDIENNPYPLNPVTHDIWTFVDNDGEERDRVGWPTVKYQLTGTILQVAHTDGFFYIFYRIVNDPGKGIFYDQYEYILPDKGVWVKGTGNVGLGPLVRTVDITSITTAIIGNQIAPNNVIVGHNMAWFDPEVGEPSSPGGTII